MRPFKKFPNLAPVLAATLVMNPYSFNFDGKDQPKVAAESSFARDIYVSSNNKFDSLLKGIKNDKHEFLKKVKGDLDNGKIKLKASKKAVSFEQYEDLAFNVEEVRSDKALQKKLNKAIKDGAKVYIYGGVAIPEYADLLGLDKVTTIVKDENGKDMEFQYDLSQEELIELGGELKNNPNSEANPDDLIYEVVGYTLDGEEHNQLTVTKINNFDEDGNRIKATEEQMIAEILESSQETIKVEEAQYAAAQAPKILGLLSKMNAKAVSTVISSTTRTEAKAWYGGTAVGRTYTSWKMQQASDRDSYWDYFNIHDYSTIDASTGWRAYQWWVNHDIPYDRDYIEDWDPSDTSSGSYTVAAAVPWDFSISYEFTTDPVVDDQGYEPLDYGRWVITDYNMDGERFNPGTFWKSRQSYQLARIDIGHKGYFTNSRGYKANSSITVVAVYHY